MTINLNDKVVSFDCDDTLVMWGDNPYEPKDGRLCFINPNGGEHIYLTPHHLHIRKLRGYANSGWFVIVWSMGGGDWAKEVVEKLGLQDSVHLITSKPVVLFDDLPLNEAFGERKYWMPKKGYE